MSNKNLFKIAAAKAVILGKDAFHVEKSNSLIIKGDASISPDRKDSGKFNVFLTVKHQTHLYTITDNISLLDVNKGLRVSIGMNKSNEPQVSFFGFKDAETALTLVEKLVFNKKRALRV